MTKNSFYITTTLPYVNAPLHMGHALEFVRADVIARYKKLQGFDVFFNTGTDEHGMKIYEKAKEEGMEVLDFVNKGFEIFKTQLKMFGILEDIHYIRTTDKKHIKSAQEFWNRVNNNGFIYKKNYETKYCVNCESEKTISELNDDGRCFEHPNSILEIINEENYFFKYSFFTQKLLDFYESEVNFIIPDFRFKEIKSFVERGLNDFSISRLKSKMPWGIPVPGDEEHVMYVWFDALTNYINTLGWPNDNENFEKYWINGNPTQYCGKDNTRFQGAMWQAMLMAAGIPNSHQIVVNGFIVGEGGIKMSKSLGNIVDPKEIVNEYGTDALRYFLLREISSFEDSPFSFERFKESYNANLANGLGNLTSRIMKMVVSYDVDYDLFDEKIMQEKFEMLFSKEMESFNIKNVLDDIWIKIANLDRKIAEEKPFMYFKDDRERVKISVSALVVFLDEIAFNLRPFLPETADKIRKLIKEKKMPDQPLFLRK